MWTPDPSKIVTAEQKIAAVQEATLSLFRAAVQAHLDAKAHERLYDNGFTLASYSVSTIPTWKAEADAFVVWRDAVWAYALEELAKVKGGERELPSVEDLLRELPNLIWP